MSTENLSTDRSSPSMFATVTADIRVLRTYRFLIANLVKKELHLKYRSSVLGYCWSLLNPILLIATYVVAFKFILKVGVRKGYDIDYVAVLMTGIVFWQFFSTALSSSAGSVLNNISLLQKVRFPRVIPVLSNHLFQLALHLLIWPFLFLALFLLFDAPVGWHVLGLVPTFILLNIFLFGAGLFLATATVFFRDVRHFLELALRSLFWLSPIVYPMHRVPDSIAPFIRATPFTPFVMSLRSSLCFGEIPETNWLVQSAGYAFTALALGLFVFYRYQRRFVEEF